MRTAQQAGGVELRKRQFRMLVGTQRELTPHPAGPDRPQQTGPLAS